MSENVSDQPTLLKPGDNLTVPSLSATSQGDMPTIPSVSSGPQSAIYSAYSAMPDQTARRGFSSGLASSLLGTTQAKILAAILVLVVVAVGGVLFATRAPTQRTVTSHQTQSKTVSATGQVTTPGTQASGIACIDNFDTANSLTLQAGSTYANTYGTINIHMVLDVTATLPPAPSTTVWSQRCVPAHILEAGSIGNHEFNSNISGSLSYSVFNNPPFSNGQDPQTYTAVQQSDIDAAADLLKAAARQSAVAALSRQLQSNEHLVGDPQCTYFVNSDHSAGARANSVTVTVNATCTDTAST